MLDANTCIYVITYGRGDEAAHLVRQRPGSVVTSAVAYAEVVKGLLGDDIATAAAARLFERAPVQSFDTAAAEVYAHLPFRRGSFDRLIAAHAIALDLTLVTANTRDFSDIPGLRLANWSAGP
jgi:tRNA(fMet)-specific endonuclease VapC